MALRAMAPSASSAREIDRFHLEQPLVLLHQRVLGLRENELKGRLVEILERGDDGQSADEFRDQDIFQKVVRLNLAENSDIIAMTEFDRTGT